MISLSMMEAFYFHAGINLTLIGHGKEDPLCVISDEVILIPHLLIYVMALFGQNLLITSTIS